MNPTDNTPNQNVGMNQGNPTVNNGQFVTPSPIGFSVPQQGPVTPTPMPAPQAPVTPQPMPAAPTPVTPTPVTQSVAPQPTPQTVPMASEGTKEDPNAKLAEVNIPPSANNNAEPEVINTAKSKGSNILLFIVIVILIVFAVNIDKMSELYDNYMKTGSLTASNVTPDNTTEGFIKINDSSSSMKVNNIRFSNFRKNDTDLTISYNYESFEKFEDTSKLNIFVEIYNNNKELLYKEQFNVEGGLEINTTANNTMTLEEDMFTGAFYALARVYTGTDLSATSTLTCKYTDKDYQYENKYYFTSNELNKYDVTKTSLKEDNTALAQEYESLKGKINVVFDNNAIRYSVDLEKENQISPVYPKGLTPAIIKNREALKEWKCE